MIVRRTDFERVLEHLLKQPCLSLDCETTGLRPYHGDRLFSVILGAPDLVAGAGGSIAGFYFNFQTYLGVPEEEILPREWLEKLALLFADPLKRWYLFNAKFDLAMLAMEGFSLAGEIHCAKALARVEYNDHPPGSYDLETCAARIGETKDDAVERFIEENGLWKWADIPGKKKRDKLKFYDQIPFGIIAPYGERDAQITYRLARSQEEAIEKLDAEIPETLPHLSDVAANERRLTKTVFRMEQLGLKIDRPYCVRAARYEADRAEKAAEEFRRLTGREYKASPKLFAEVFADQREQWSYTEEGNPSFDADALKLLSGPVAAEILRLRDAKAKADFYHGFLHHADADDVVHPNLDPAGTASGRFSSSSPNFQNLTSEEDEEELAQEFVVRRAIIPRPGYILLMPDYDQMEYRMMLDIAADILERETPLIQEVKKGKDVHQATADLVLQVSGIDIGRSKAKNGNFAKLYGAGIPRLAETLKCDIAGAVAVNNAIDKAAPEIARLCHVVSATAERRGFIFNWLGRRCFFKNKRLSYKAPNYLIQGGCADVVKVAMNRVDDYLRGRKSRMILQIHDELVVEAHESEAAEVARGVHEVMESIYPWKYLKLSAGMEYSTASMADKKKGWPG